MSGFKNTRTCSYSDWMSQLPSPLHDVPLWNLAIPGSHDTMTYCLDQHSPVLHSEPRILRVLDHVVPCIIRPCVNKWATTQQCNVCNQLDAGIRFLDLRIAHKSGDFDDTFYFAHGIYSLVTVKEALTEVTYWLSQHTKEVIMISLSAFDNVNPDQHENLIVFLLSIFGKKLCPKSVIPSLSNCYSHGYQVILSYADPAAYGHLELWPVWDYWWANESDPKLVISYLENKKQKAGRPEKNFFVAGLNLTEDTKYVLLHPRQSMKSMTLQAYTLLMTWVKQQCPGSKKTCLNIICTDFVGILQNEFSQLVISLNKHLLNQTSGIF